MKKKMKKKKIRDHIEVHGKLCNVRVRRNGFQFYYACLKVFFCFVITEYVYT